MSGTCQVTSEETGEKFTLFFTIVSPFSNFHSCSFEAESLDGSRNTFSSVEQFYMYNKAVLFDDQKIAKRILAEQNARTVKKMSAEIKGFNKRKWDEVSGHVMTIALCEKFAQNRNLRRLLFLTHDTELVEASPMDNTWGIGLSLDDPRARERRLWRGQNKLGKLMTQMRNKYWEDEEYRDDREFAEKKLNNEEYLNKVFRVIRSERRSLGAPGMVSGVESTDRESRKRRRQTIGVVDQSVKERIRGLLVEEPIRKRARRSRSRDQLNGDDAGAALQEQLLVTVRSAAAASGSGMNRRARRAQQRSNLVPPTEEDDSQDVEGAGECRLKKRKRIEMEDTESSTTDDETVVISSDTDQIEIMEEEESLYDETVELESESDQDDELLASVSRPTSMKRPPPQATAIPKPISTTYQQPTNFVVTIGNSVRTSGPSSTSQGTRTSSIGVVGGGMGGQRRHRGGVSRVRNDGQTSAAARTGRGNNEASSLIVILD